MPLSPAGSTNIVVPCFGVQRVGDWKASCERRGAWEGCFIDIRSADGEDAHLQAVCKHCSSRARGGAACLDLTPLGIERGGCGRVPPRKQRWVAESAHCKAGLKVLQYICSLRLRCLAFTMHFLSLASRRTICCSQVAGFLVSSASKSVAGRPQASTFN